MTTKPKVGDYIVCIKQPHMFFNDGKWVIGERYCMEGYLDEKEDICWVRNQYVPLMYFDLEVSYKRLLKLKKINESIKKNERK